MRCVCLLQNDDAAEIQIKFFRPPSQRIIHPSIDRSYVEEEEGGEMWILIKVDHHLFFKTKKANNIPSFFFKTDTSFFLFARSFAHIWPPTHPPLFIYNTIICSFIYFVSFTFFLPLLFHQSISK